MPQIIRPVSDFAVGSWLNESGLDVDLFDSINEVTNNDANYIDDQAISDQCHFILDNTLVDPVSSSGHTVVVRAKDEAGGGGDNIQMQLYQGVTLRATLAVGLLTGSYANFSVNLSAAQANAITNYADLSITLQAQNALGNQIRVSNLHFQVPDAPVATAPGRTSIATMIMTKLLPLRR